jgi:hypothetical protein
VTVVSGYWKFVEFKTLEASKRNSRLLSSHPSGTDLCSASVSCPKGGPCRSLRPALPKYWLGVGTLTSLESRVPSAETDRRVVGQRCAQRLRGATRLVRRGLVDGRIHDIRTVVAKRAFAAKTEVVHETDSVAAPNHRSSAPLICSDQSLTTRDRAFPL